MQFETESSQPIKFKYDDHTNPMTTKTLSHKPSTDHILLSTDIINKLK
jgi:hypothetical protein